jgi:transcriptional regulator with PAS, ATPase and Fis domain
MSIATLIIGESGTGKSTSMRNLKPEDVLLIQAVKKPLPFRSTNWKPVVKDQGGSVFVTDDSAKIVAAMERTQKAVIVIDDFQYVLANEFMRRVTDNETGNSAFAKYNEIARHAWDVLMKATSLADHKRVYILSHTSTDEFGKTKVKTIGKLLDEKIVLEGLVTIVLRTMKINDQYLFSTQNSGSDTVKSPLGLFEDGQIENDLLAVDNAICEYYGIAQPAF